MNLYYDPIFGLQYSFDDNAGMLLRIDTASIPQDFNLEKVMYYLRKQGTMIVNSKINVEPIYVDQIIESNAWFGLKEEPRFSDIWTRPFMYGTGGKMDLEAQDEFRKMFEDAHD